MSARRHRARATVCGVALLAVVVPTTAFAGVQGGVSASFGARVLDAALDDYRWDVSPAPVFGAEAFASRGRFDLALAFDRSATEQATGLSSTAPRVDLTQLGLRARARLFSIGPFTGTAGAGIGRMHLAWNPDSQRLDVDGLGTPIRVDYQPIDTWRRELEVGARIALPGPVDLGLVSTWARFDLDTAHRAGDEVVERRETFSTFDARVLLRWSPWGEP